MLEAFVYFKVFENRADRRVYAEPSMYVVVFFDRASERCDV
jgi:hypothetical protein